jgi:hypothetical protein
VVHASQLASSAAPSAQTSWSHPPPPPPPPPLLLDELEVELLVELEVLLVELEVLLVEVDVLLDELDVLLEEPLTAQGWAWQTFAVMFTQLMSQPMSQQNSSVPQTAATHGSHAAVSAAPALQMS